MTVNRILCCVDFSSNAEKAFNASLELAEKYKAQLHLLHVLPPVVNPLITDIDIAVPEESTKALVQKLEAQMITVYGKKIKNHIDYVIAVQGGHVSSEILNYILDEKIDLVVVGAYGLAGVELVLFGSVAKRIAHKAPCSVMIIREKE
ncbi:MAG: universal stress protein [Thermodesulfobacteriota bacterium]|nr:universal stress protein [Thermodesulfobacteriota bacterium]